MKNSTYKYDKLLNIYTRFSKKHIDPEHTVVMLIFYKLITILMKK